MRIDFSIPVSDRLASILGDPEALKEICAHVTTGGSLIELCRSWKIPFGQVMHWIRKEPERSKIYDKAESDRVQYFTEEILHELNVLRQMDMKDILEENGSVKPVSEWPALIGRWVSSMDVIETFNSDGEPTGYIKKIRFHDKIRATELLGKRYALFVELMKHEHSGAIKLEDLVPDGRRGPAETR